jgi:hypothetical protein
MGDTSDEETGVKKWRRRGRSGSLARRLDRGVVLDRVKDALAGASARLLRSRAAHP